MTEKRKQQIEDALSNDLENPELIKTILNGLSDKDLLAFHESRTLTLGILLADATLRESYEIIRERNYDGFMLLINLATVETLSLRDVLILTRQELRRRKLGEFAESSNPSSASVVGIK